MKQRILACGLLLCSMLCMLSSCGKEAPLPEESVVSAVSAVESVPEEPTGEEDQKLAAELLSAFFAGELSAERENGVTEWIDSDRVRELREQVKAIGKPFLTEETVQQVAAYTAEVCAEAVQKEQAVISLPAFDTMSEPMEWVASGGVIAGYDGYASYEARSIDYNVLLAYTLYLFTPPKYAFAATEVHRDSLTASSDLQRYQMVYLALAGAYDNWRDALTAMKEQRQGVILYVRDFEPGVRTPEFGSCYDAASLLRDGREGLALELCDMFPAEDPAENPYLLPYAQEYVAKQMKFYSGALSYRRVYYDAESGARMPILPETVKKIRALREYLTEPFLTETDMLFLSMWTIGNSEFDNAAMICLPDADGMGGDALLDPPPEENPNQQQQRVFAYLADLFTPSAFRFTDLLSRPGTYYALAEEGSYLLVTEDFQSCTIDAEGNLFPLFWWEGSAYDWEESA